MDLSTVFGFQSLEQLRQEYAAAVKQVEQTKKQLKDAIVQLAAELPPQRQEEVLNTIISR